MLTFTKIILVMFSRNEVSLLLGTLIIGVRNTTILRATDFMLYFNDFYPINYYGNSYLIVGLLLLV